MFIDVAEFGLRGGTGKITMMQDVAMHIDPHVILKRRTPLKDILRQLVKIHQRFVFKIRLYI
jgi:hypothetical protein